MEEDNSIIISQLRNKIDQLVEKYQFLKKENVMLHSENQRLTDQLTQSVNDYSVIEGQYNALKFSKTIAGDEKDSHDAKIRINKIVREIDKCIALLNR